MSTNNNINNKVVICEMILISSLKIDAQIAVPFFGSAKRMYICFHSIFPWDSAKLVLVMCHDYVAEVAVPPSTSWREDVTGVESDVWRDVFTAKCERWLFTVNWCWEKHMSLSTQSSIALFISMRPEHHMYLHYLFTTVKTQIPIGRSLFHVKPPEPRG